MSQADEYHDAMIDMLELVWGDGFMAPGGPQCIRLLRALTALAEYFRSPAMVSPHSSNAASKIRCNAKPIPAPISVQRQQH